MLGSLPGEIALLVLLEVDARTLLRCREACARLRDLVGDGYFAREKLRREAARLRPLRLRVTMRTPRPAAGASPPPAVSLVVQESRRALSRTVAALCREWTEWAGPAGEVFVFADDRREAAVTRSPSSRGATKG